jgi:tetratricopeptide (TPR) repeat protein
MFDIFKPTKEKAENLFRQAMRTGNFGPAVAYYRNYVDANRRDFEAQNDLGWMLTEAGEPEQALAHFEAANEVQKQSAHYNNMGRALLKLERFDEASDAFETAHELDPDDEQPVYNMTVCLRSQDKTDECMQALEALLDDHGEFAPALNDYALCLQELERDDESVDYLERAVEARPMWVPARINAINTLCDLGRYPEATVHLEELDEMGAEIIVDLGEDDVVITINGSTIYEGDLVEDVPGFGE